MKTVILVNMLVIISLIISFKKDKKKTKKAIMVSIKSLGKIAPSILSVILLIGIMFGLFSDKIALFFGQENGLIGFISIALFGSVIHMPSLLAFPLAGSFLKRRCFSKLNCCFYHDPHYDWSSDFTIRNKNNG